MIFYIGEDCIMPDGRIGHIQDTNYLSLSAKVGIPDMNNLIWDAKWYFFDNLKKIEVQMEDKYFFQNESGQWFHYDETWSDDMGPFQTREEAEISLKKYVKYLKHGENMIFNQIWNMQHELNKVIGKDTVFADNKLEWLFMYCEALNDEVIELMNCYGLSYLKNSKYEVNERHYKNAKIEAIDCLHFLMSIFQILNFKEYIKFENKYIKFENNTEDIILHYYNFVKRHNNGENNHLVIYHHITNLLNYTNKIKNRTNWKWWSKSVKANPNSQFKLLINKDEIANETSMALLELMYVFYYLNMTPEDILDVYEKKCQINHERQKDGYDMATKTESDNLELEKQI